MSQFNRKAVRAPKKKPIRPPMHAAGEPEEKASIRIGGSVSSSKITLISDIHLLPQWVRERFRQYRASPWLFLLDLPWFGLALSLLGSIFHLIFTAYYYGSATNILSDTLSGFFASDLGRIVLLVSVVSGIALILISTGKLLLKISRVPPASSLMLPILIAAFFMAATGGIEILAKSLRSNLIQRNYITTLNRVKELYKAGQYSQAVAVMQDFSSEKRAPGMDFYDVVKGADTSEGLIPKTAEDPYQEDQPGESARKLAKVKNSAKTVGDILTAACELSSQEDWQGLLPDWRFTVYDLTHNRGFPHDEIWGYLQELVAEYPSCDRLASPFWMAIAPKAADLIDWKYSRNLTESYTIGYLYDLVAEDIEEEAVDQQAQDVDIPEKCVVEPISQDEWSINNAEKVMKRCAFDVQLMETLLESYADDPYADYARLLLKKYNEILYEGGYAKNPHVFDITYYNVGLSKFNRGDYKGSREIYNAFLNLEIFREHQWRDDARWRIAMTYMLEGDYSNALTQLDLMKEEPDGIVPENKDMESSTLYIADVLMPIQQLQDLLKLDGLEHIKPVLAYTLAERLLSEMRFEEAREQFIQVINQYGTHEIVSSPKTNYLKLALDKLDMIDTITNSGRGVSGNLDLAVVHYLDIFGDLGPFENQLRRTYLIFNNSKLQPVTEEYMAARNSQLLAARLRDRYMERNPNDPQLPDLLFANGQGYEEIASWAKVPENPDFRESVKKRALNAYMQYIQRFPQHDSVKFDWALEHAGFLFLAECQFTECSLSSVTEMRGVYQSLVDTYPRHRLANNMLNWVAWAYCFEANQAGISDAQYVTAYQNALSAYQRIAKEYPEGIIGENARRNIPLIQAKVKNPSEREVVAQDQWSWPEPEE